MSLIAFEIHEDDWIEARDHFRQPWSVAAARLDVQIAGGHGDPLEVRRLAVRWGWRARRVVDLLSHRATNDAPNRAAG